MKLRAEGKLVANSDGKLTLEDLRDLLTSLERTEAPNEASVRFSHHGNGTQTAESWDVVVKWEPEL